MGTFTTDLRQAARMLVHNPGFSGVAIAALAIGIGATTAVFSVVNSILLQPLPYSQPDRLVRLVLKFPDREGQSLSIPKFMTWRDNTEAFQYVTAYNFGGPGLNLSGHGVPELVKGIHVSADYFPVFAVKPALGRAFSREEDRPGGPRLALISQGLWVRRFGSNARMVGQGLELNNELYTVVGVLPSSFRSSPPVDVFLPLQADPNTANQGHYLSGAARLKPGVSLETANAQLKIAAERFRKAHPGVMGKDESAAAQPFQEALVGDLRQPLLFLLCAVALVLLIACANVANLLLARAADRSREIAIRTALGARRSRIVRQLLTESLLLAVIGGVFGFLIGAWGARILAALSPGELTRAAEFAAAPVLDWRVLAFTMAVAIVTGLIFGLFPALHVSRSDVNSTIKESGSRSGTGRRHYARSVLVVFEIAMALLLLVSAGLMIRTFSALRQVNAGFNPNRVLSFETSLAGAKYKTTEPVWRLTDNAMHRIENLPGVTAAAVLPFLPLEGGFGLGFDIVGRALPPGEQASGGAGWMYVSDSYFKALEIPLRGGRVFTEHETRASPPVVVVNEAFAKKYWPKGGALGQRIVIGKGMGPDFTDPPREIVGVVGDVKEAGLGNPAPEEMYIPLAQLKDSFMGLNNEIIPLTWIVKTAVDSSSLTAAIQREVHAADGQLAIAHVRALDEVLSEAASRQNFQKLLLTVFSAVALLLAAIGVYGMMSYSVQQRSQEIGIRMALGARGADVLRMVIRQGMTLAGSGILIGLAAALWFSRFVKSFLFGVTPNDPLTLVAVSLTLVATALIACWIPARRATRLDPLESLRYE